MQIASTTNASPLPVAPAWPAPSGPTGEDSLFAKMLSAQKQPAERPAQVNSAQGQDKPEDAAQQPSSNAAGQADSEPADTDTSEASSASRRGTARNAPKVAARARDAAGLKSTAHAKAADADVHGQDKTKDGDKKDTTAGPSAADLAALTRPVASDAQPPATGAGDAARAATSALPGTTASALPDSATNAGAAIPLASAMAANDSSPALASLARSTQDAARIDVGDAKRDARISDAATTAAVGAEASRRTSSDDMLALQKDPPDRIEQRLEVPSFRDVAATNHVAAAAAPSQIDNIADPVSVNVAAPATSPQFNEALGVQVSVLARDGVQHAQLHLNPSEMGPISVQIALDGTRAQVDFGADSLATRQIIESGLPELASALRDAGFTLAGGGVSQHSSGQANRDDGERQSGNSSRRVNASGDVQTSAPRRSTVRLSQGGVDLYA